MPVFRFAWKTTVRKFSFQPPATAHVYSVAVKFPVLEPSDVSVEVTMISAVPVYNTVDERALIIPTAIMT
jgi:hypothetical protein